MPPVQGADQAQHCSVCEMQQESRAQVWVRLFHDLSADLLWERARGEGTGREWKFRWSQFPPAFKMLFQRTTGCSRLARLKCFCSTSISLLPFSCIYTLKCYSRHVNSFLILLKPQIYTSYFLKFLQWPPRLIQSTYRPMSLAWRNNEGFLISMLQRTNPTSRAASKSHKHSHCHQEMGHAFSFQNHATLFILRPISSEIINNANAQHWHNAAIIGAQNTY